MSAAPSWWTRWRAVAKLGEAGLVGINERNVALVYGHNRRADYPLVDDKLVCKTLLAEAGVPVAPTVAVCRGLFEVDGVVAKLRGRGAFVVKPAQGSQGNGILVIAEPAEGGWTTPSGRFVSEDELRRHLANVVFGAYSKQLEDQALVEQRVVSDPLFHELSPSGLADIRLIVLRGVVLMAMARVPTVASGGRANLHQRGVGIAIDLETGVTTRAVVRQKQLRHHPDTGALMVGREIPHWDAVLDVGLRAAECVPLGYIGADIALDAELGPLVLELNARPGLEIQNVTGELLGRKVAEAFE